MIKKTDSQGLIVNKPSKKMVAAKIAINTVTTVTEVQDIAMGCSAYLPSALVRPDCDGIRRR